MKLVGSRPSSQSPPEELLLRSNSAKNSTKIEAFEQEQGLDCCEQLLETPHDTLPGSTVLPSDLMSTFGSAQFLFFQLSLLLIREERCVVKPSPTPTPEAKRAKKIIYFCQS